MKEQIQDIFDSDCLIIPVSSTDYAEGIIENEEELISESNIKILKEEIALLSKNFKEDIENTKIKRFEYKFYKLQLKINTKIKNNKRKIKELKEEQQQKDIEFKNDISKIEDTLKSMYSRID